MTKFEKAIEKINLNGCLLVFPIKNAKEPKSIWSEFYPRSEMIWSWDEDSDNRIGNMWLLMKKLSDCNQVVYSKWYSGRATFFSRELFKAMLVTKLASQPKISRKSQEILSVLEDNSPISSKELKIITELRGKENEGLYHRSLKELFLSLRIIGYGEVEDGFFPSLAVGATRLLYEDLYREAQKMTKDEAQKIIDSLLPAGSKLRKFWDKTSF